jgi:hypothetical protein
VVPYAFGIGVEDLEEFYLGGFPDLSSFLMREGDSIELDCVRFQELLELRLPRFGKILSREIPEKLFIDLGCGRPEKSVMPRLLAQGFRAIRYLGVDHKNVKDEIRISEFRELGHFESKFIRRDLLAFLINTRFCDPRFFFLAGLEPVKNSEAAQNYLKDLANKLSEIAVEGDIVLVGAGTPSLDLCPKKFKLIYSDQYHEVFKARAFRRSRLLSKLSKPFRMIKNLSAF